MVEAWLATASSRFWQQWRLKRGDALVFFGAPIAQHHRILTEITEASGIDAALLAGYNAIASYSEVQDFEGMMSVFQLLENKFHPIDRMKIIRSMLWSSLHTHKPDPNTHRRLVKIWHTADVAPWLSTHKLLPIRRRGKAKVRVGLIGLELLSGGNSILEYLMIVVETLSQKPFDLVLYAPESLTIPDRLEKQNLIVRKIKRYDQSAREIIADGLDILLYLAGVNPEIRKNTESSDKIWQLFAQRPARFLGMLIHSYATWGPDVFDFSVLDPFVAPPTHEALVWERVERLSFFGLFGPISYAPPVAPLPAISNGYVTFGCFNRPTKIDRMFVELWREILARLPTARLRLSNVLLSKPYHRNRIDTLMAEAGIARERVDLLDDVPPQAEFLERYARVDISLDPLWFNGGLTSFESLWQGVPVLTCPSDYAVGRMSLALLSQIDLTDWIAADHAAYVDRAVEAAGDLATLAKLRAGLRTRIARSRLFDREAHGAELRDLLVRIANGPERPR